MSFKDEVSLFGGDSNHKVVEPQVEAEVLVKVKVGDCFLRHVQEFNLEIIIELGNDPDPMDWLGQKVVRNPDMQVLPAKVLDSSFSEAEPKKLPLPFDLPLDEFQLKMAVFRQKPGRPDHFFIFPFLLELEQRKVALVCLNDLPQG